MSRPHLAPHLLVLAGALAACSGPQESPRSCSGASDCPADARCRSSVCVANGTPVASITAPASPVAFALVSLSGAGSSDPDPEDAVASYRWTVRSAGAPCPPPSIAGTSSTVQVRFGCAGAHEVELVVVDGLGVESAPARAAVNVVPDPDPPLVTAGADVFTQHTCSGTPVTCRPEAGGGTIALSSTGPSGPGITYAWIVQPPPGREPGPGRRVTFSPGPDAPDPTVTLETDGLALSGDWVFRVEARDAAGPVGAAATRISVGNREPVVAGTMEPVQHTYAAVAQRFEAAGTVHLAVTDPDGDPVPGRQVTVHRLNDGPASTFTAADVGDRITFSIVVPYDGPDAPGRLIGGAGLSRTLRFAVSDVNGAQVAETWDVVVGNRPPELATPVTPVAVDHTYSAATSSYVATAVLSSWLDPDGDPLSVPQGSVAPPCAQPTLAGGSARVTCSVPFGGSPAADQLAGTWMISHAVSDPWETSALAVTKLTIGNRPPEILETSFHAAGTCQPRSTCCEYDTEMHVCLAHQLSWSSGAAASGAWLADPDGDPLLVSFGPSGVTITPGSAVCAPDACAFSFAPPALSACALDGETVQANVTDGGPALQAYLNVHRDCL